MRQYILLVHPANFVRGSNQPLGTDAEIKYILANSFEQAELLAANFVDLDDCREYDVFEIPETATWCGIDITPKPDALVFYAIDTPIEPGAYFYRESDRGRLEQIECYISQYETLAAMDLSGEAYAVDELLGKWYKEKKV